jgi:TonB family protein
LRPTQVRVAVAADGTVHYAVLHRPTGNEAADAEALRFARALRFAPRQDTDAAGLTWGLVRFLWATAPP